jgi:DNA-binding response OmpR family regulator
MAKILYVEDNEKLIDSVIDWMAMERHKVDTALTGTAAIERLQSFDYELVILDWDLPEINGLDVLKQYRSKKGTAAVLMLTGKGAIEDKTQAFENGADDYLTKPFHPKELAVRVNALLRRPRQIIDNNRIDYHGLVLDVGEGTVTRRDKSHRLRPAELSLLEFMLRHPTEVFSPEALLNGVWSSDNAISIDAIYACISRIRKKLDAPDDAKSVIETVHGRGYTIGV